MYEIYLSVKTDKFLSKLDSHISTRIKERLKKLAKKPIPQDAKFIEREEDDKIFRYRIGDYRALYKVKDNEKMILIMKIDKRPRVYHR